MGGVAELLSGSGVDSGGLFGGLGEVLGVMLAHKMHRNPENIEKSMAPRGRRFQGGFLMVFVSKQPGRPQSLYLSLGILLSNAYRRLQHRHRNLFVLGGNMAPCWPSKSRKIAVREASGRGLGEVLGGF